MAYGKAFLEFATTYQDPKQSNTYYYNMFKSRQYTVTVHGKQTGYHLKLHDKHWKILVVTEEVVDEQVIDTARLK